MDVCRLGSGAGGGGQGTPTHPPTFLEISSIFLALAPFSSRPSSRACSVDSHSTPCRSRQRGRARVGEDARRAGGRGGVWLQRAPPLHLLRRLLHEADVEGRGGLVLLCSGDSEREEGRRRARSRGQAAGAAARRRARAPLPTQLSLQQRLLGPSPGISASSACLMMSSLSSTATNMRARGDSASTRAKPASACTHQSKGTGKWKGDRQVQRRRSAQRAPHCATRGHSSLRLSAPAGPAPRQQRAPSASR